jgi:hypothetical protein
MYFIHVKSIWVPSFFFCHAKIGNNYLGKKENTWISAIF